MGDGYYIYEPLRLSRVLAHTELHDLLIEFQESLIEKLYFEFSLSPEKVLVKVIEVTYLGSYPAIGIKKCDKLWFDKIVEFLDSVVDDELDHFIEKKRGSINPELVTLFEKVADARET